MLSGGATRRTYSEISHHELQDPSGPRERPEDDTCHATCFVVKSRLGLCPGRITCGSNVPCEGDRTRSSSWAFEGMWGRDWVGRVTRSSILPMAAMASSIARILALKSVTSGATGPCCGSSLVVVSMLSATADEGVAKVDMEGTNRLLKLQPGIQGASTKESEKGIERNSKDKGIEMRKGEGMGNTEGFKGRTREPRRRFDL
jgi:hypothetical protein